MLTFFTTFFLISYERHLTREQTIVRAKMLKLEEKSETFALLILTIILRFYIYSFERTNCNKFDLFFIYNP